MGVPRKSDKSLLNRAYGCFAFLGLATLPVGVGILFSILHWMNFDSPPGFSASSSINARQATADKTIARAATRSRVGGVGTSSDSISGFTEQIGYFSAKCAIVGEKSPFHSLRGF